VVGVVVDAGFEVVVGGKVLIGVEVVGTGRLLPLPLQLKTGGPGMV
jgi:hypothetical protein